MRTYSSTIALKITNLTLADFNKQVSFFTNYLIKNKLSDYPKEHGIELAILLLFPNANELEQFLIYKAVESNNKGNWYSIRESFPHILFNDTYRVNKNLLKELNITELLSANNTINKYLKYKK